MARMTLSGLVFSTALFSVLAGVGAAGGWLLQPAPAAGRGKQVVVLALGAEEAAGERALMDPSGGGDDGSLPPAVIPTLPGGFSRGEGTPIIVGDGGPAAGGRRTQPSSGTSIIPATPGAGGDVLVITLPDSGGPSVQVGMQDVAMPNLPDPGPIGAIEPDAPAATGPVTPLPAAPIAGLTQPGAHGLLPVIAADGRMPRTAYARPYVNLERKPAIAIVVGGLGYNAAVTRAAIARLPGAVTLAFIPYAPRLDEWIREARRAGHEVLIELPLEPVDYPRPDVGPKVLLTDLGPNENIDRLEWMLARSNGAVGVMNYLGGAFAASASALTPVLGALSNRGMLFVETPDAPRSEVGAVARTTRLPHRRAGRMIDADSAAAVRGRLDKVVEGLGSGGTALAIGNGGMTTIEAVRAWSADAAAAGLVLAPVSAVVR